MITFNPSSKIYRVSTIWRSFKALYRTTPEKAEAFLKSYEIYDCDWEHGQAMKDGKKIDYAEIKQGLLSWYGIINHLCALTEVEKMYIPPTLDPTKSVIKNQILFEEQFAKQLDLKKGDKVFELGCGKGRVAAHLASISGAQITGINIDQEQLDNAKQFAEKNMISNLCHFVNADLNDLPIPYPDNSFDAVYEIQALSLSKDLEKLFVEIARVLKPGGKISLLEWVKLPKFDPDNQHHQKLMQGIKPLIGAIGTPSPAEYESFLEKAGFEILVSRDPSINQAQKPLIEKTDKHFKRFYPFVKFLVKVKLLPHFFSALFERASQNVDAFCEADLSGLITTSYHIVAQKK